MSESDRDMRTDFSAAADADATPDDAVGSNPRAVANLGMGTDDHARRKNDSLSELGARMDSCFLRMNIELVFGIELARDRSKHATHCGARKQNGVGRNRVARLVADKAPSRLCGEEVFLAPPSIKEGEMRRASLPQACHVKNQCCKVCARWAIEAHRLTELRQTEGTAIV